MKLFNPTENTMINIKTRLFLLMFGFCICNQGWGQQTRLGQDVVAICFTCHGEKGASKVSQYPILAGQHEYYMYVQLKDFKAGRRASPEMNQLTANLSKEEMKAFAKYFTQQEWPALGMKASADIIQQGKTAAVAGQCVQCHRGGYEGDSRIPRLAGLHSEYLEKTMLDFKYKRRNNAAAKSSLFASFSDEDITALAGYIGSLSVQKKSHGSEIQ